MLEPGVYPASVTPFDDKGRIDMPAVANLLAWFRAGGCKGVVLAGTNGEGPSLSAVEKRDLAKAAVPLAQGLAVVLGIATPSLDEAVWLTKQAAEAGCAACLVMPPGYFREATDEGLALWFEELFNKSPSPILVYNFPKRTGVTLSCSMIHRLSRHPRMIGVKDSSGEFGNLAGYATALRGTSKCLFVGDETLLLKALQQGWTGTISGAANVLPHWLSRVVAEWHENRESAETKFELLRSALAAIRSQPQPATNKAVLAQMGVLPSEKVRLPLQGAKDVDEVLQQVLTFEGITS